MTTSSIEDIADEMDAFGLTPDPVSMALAMKATLVDLPMIFAREMLRMNIRLALACLDETQTILGLIGPGRQLTAAKPSLGEDAPARGAATTLDVINTARRAA